jgi:trimeric autotransporter adhesin
MRKFYLQLLLCVFVIGNYASGQVTLSGTSYTELFDNIGSGLPTGWTVRTGATASSLGTAATLTTAATAWNNTAGAFKNFASADGLTSTSTSTQQAASTDRALGLRQTGAVGDPGGAFTLQLANTSGFSNFTLTFDLQSLDISSPRQTTWLVQYGLGSSPSSFTTVATVPTPLQTGNSTFTNTNVSVNFGSALDNQAGEVWIRVVTLAPSTNTGNRPSTGIDDFVLSYSPSGPDVTPPTVSTLTPPDNATGVTAASTASITFSEPIQKGAAGTITVKDAVNNTVQTIDVTTGAVTVSGSTASFNLSLSPATSYYIEVSAGAFEDLAGNDYAGISDNTTWNFTTSGILNTLLNANFNTCTSTLTDGFTQFSAVGTITWGCTTFGRDANNPPTGSAPNGVQINGFDNGLQSNVPNEDWLISPALNLTGTTYPLLSFWSRTRFNGDPLQLKISTDYPGSGDPRNYTWTDLNGRFPGQTTDVWTQSSNINLSAFKQANVYIAFVYNSSDEDGARWTLDDVRVDNSAVPPPASLTTSSTDLQFGYTASGANSVKTFTLTPNDITADVTLTVNGPFQLSKDGSTFSSSINYTVAEANNLPQTVHVRFAPTQNAQNYSDSVIISTTGANAKVYVKGTSLDPATTLEVVNWNIEWFGSASNGPTNDAQQEQNVRTIMQNVNADLYAFTEIVSEARLASLVASLPGYSYVISNYGSHTNPNSPTPSPLADAQKMAFVYRTSLFSNVTTTALLSLGINSPADVSTTSYNNWASGRFPYMMNADVTLNGVTKNMKFVLVHAKANTSPTTTSYNRRKAGADELHALLNSTYGSDNVIMLGDYNDDLDFTITDGINPPTTSYVAFTSDNSNYGYATLPLSLAGKKSTVSYNDVIDHVIYSNELGSSYINSSATILTDAALLVTNYASTTSDHYPVFSRFRFSVQAPLPVNLEYFTAQKPGVCD